MKGREQHSRRKPESPGSQDPWAETKALRFSCRGSMVTVQEPSGGAVAADMRGGYPGGFGSLTGGRKERLAGLGVLGGSLKTGGFPVLHCGKGEGKGPGEGIVGAVRGCRAA